MQLFDSLELRFRFIEKLNTNKHDALGTGDLSSLIFFIYSGFLFFASLCASKWKGANFYKELIYFATISTFWNSDCSDSLFPFPLSRKLGSQGGAVLGKHGHGRIFDGQ